MKRFNAAKALKVDDSLYQPLEKAIIHIFTQIIYKPLFKIVSEELTDGWFGLELPKVQKARQEQIKETLKQEREANKEIIPEGMVTNAKMKEAASNPLVRAILTGRVQYIYDHFEGSFSARISQELRKIGAKWDSRRKVWRATIDKLTPEVSLAIGTSGTKRQEVVKKINAHLDDLQAIVDNSPEFMLDKVLDKIIQELEVQFKNGIKDFIIPPEFTPEMVKNIIKYYEKEINLGINGWTQESIDRLRKRVLENTFKGYRSSSLVKELEHDFQISHNKARFLARQETSFLMSLYREERYKSVGVDKYTWSTSGDSRVRPMHKRLNGKVFSWTNPPVVDEQGHRRHPGQDWGCRCIAIPLLDDGEWHPNYSIGNKEYDVTNPREFAKAKSDLDDLMKQKKQFAYDKYERIDERYRTEKGLKSLKKDSAKMDKELYWRTKDLLGQANSQSDR